MGTFVKVATLDQLRPGQVQSVEVQGHGLALFNLEGVCYALENGCPHRGAPLSSGIVQGDEVICPWHGARFKISTGASLTPISDDDVRCYATRIVGEEIEVEL